ncbi:MAG: hypothetical protein Kow0045_15870 [Albidovulum sp.]
MVPARLAALATVTSGISRGDRASAVRVKRFGLCAEYDTGRLLADSWPPHSEGKMLKQGLTLPETQPLIV